VTEINRAGENNSLGHIDTSQGHFRSQIDALTDAVRQLGGNAEIKESGSVVNDPLNAPYQLYVNPYIGSDTFVTGDYATADDGTFEQKMRRISLQRLECGYTEARPFKTINRAVIEAAIITSRDYLNLPGNLCGDLVSINIAPGVHTIVNDPGIAYTSADFPTWSDGYEPTVSDLAKFNAVDGGVILPRGVSLCSIDLRKCNLRPNYVPGQPGDSLPLNEAADYSNRRPIFRVTGTGFFYGFTFIDKLNYEKTHHLLDTFSFTGRTRADVFYEKILSSFGAHGGISSTFTKTRDSEVIIVAPAPAPGLQTIATDGVSSASPYIYNCSIRSKYGMCGIFANGDDVEGFKSMVVAQYTAIALQRDMRCWERYVSGAWQQITADSGNPHDNYSTYIAEQPDNLRQNTSRRTFHIRCVNKSIIQEVSVFAIGQSVHHWVESGGELTVTNSNSNFGGCASLAEGFHDETYATDTDWSLHTINVARDITPLRNKFATYQLGEIVAGQSNTATSIQLTSPLDGDELNKPRILAVNGYSLNNYGTTNYVWIENTNGNDYYAPLADVAWETSAPDTLNFSSAFVAVGGSPPTDSPAGNLPPIAGLRVYVRRLRDVRNLEERTYSITCNNTSTQSRNIVRDYGIQTDIAETSIDTYISDDEPIIVGKVSVLAPQGSGVIRRNKVEIRRAAASDDWDNRGEYRSGYHATNNYYRPGDVVRYLNKHYKCIVEHIATSTFETQYWDQAFVHMPSNYAPEDFFKNTKKPIVFDRDKDTTNEDPFLGYVNSDLWQDEQLYRQLRTNSDYLGLYSLLRSLGFTNTNAHKILRPKDTADRERNPGTSLDSIANPSGAANTWDNWSLTMRRPSNIRLFGHAFEWAGLNNYSKALPKYQKDLTASNKFTFFFTNSAGGRVYLNGFNEEGFQVTAAGLIDLQTGEVLSPEGLGSDDASTDNVIFPGDVTVEGTLTANTLQTDQQALVFIKHETDNPAPPSAGLGLAYIAPATAITGMHNNGTPIPEAATFDTNNEEGTVTNGSSSLATNKGYSGPHFVTPAWIDLWKGKNGLLGVVSGSVNIFVNPRAIPPVNPALVNSIALESLNHDADITQLIGTPPLSPETACPSLKLAIEFANLAVSTTTRVNYYLGCGVYSDDCVTHDFKHPVLLQGYSFELNQLSSDGRGGGGHKFMADSISEGDWNSGRGIGWTAAEGGVGNGGGKNKLALDSLSGGNNEIDAGGTLESTFKNATLAPCFITNVKVRLRNAGQWATVDFASTRFVFRNESTIQGMHVWGATTTAEMGAGTRDNTGKMYVPNEHFGLTSTSVEKIRTQTDRRKVLNAWVYQQCQLLGVSVLRQVQSNSTFQFQNQLVCRDVAISATDLPYKNAGQGDDQPLFNFIDNATLHMAGCYLIGNNTLDDQQFDGNTGGSLQWGSSNNFDFFGFTNAFMSINDRSPNAVATVKFGHGRAIVDAASDFDRNLVENNIHLLTSNYRYMETSHRAAEEASAAGAAFFAATPDDKYKQGPAFGAVYGNSAKGRRVDRHNFTDYRVSRDWKCSGVVGFFGLYRFRRGGSYSAFRQMGLSVLDNAAAQKPGSTTDGNPNSAIVAGTNFDWEATRGFLFRRNGLDQFIAITGAITSVGPGVVRHPIFSQAWGLGMGGVTPELYALNLKYAVIKPGIDFGHSAALSNNAGPYSSNNMILG